MTAYEPLVRIVDDDEAVRAALSFMLECEGYRVAAYPDAAEFLRADPPSQPGCLVLDVKMPGMSGLELQRELIGRSYKVPIVFLTGHGDIDMAVSVLKDGAVDFVQKPINDIKFLAAIRRAIQLDRERRGLTPSAEAISAMLSELTAREREILELVVKGLLNREIARKLHISERTVEGHRMRAFHKLHVRSVPELLPFFSET